MIHKIIIILASILFVSCSRPKIVEETPEYIYVQEYSLFNTDSIIKKYPQSIKYEGIVMNTAQRVINVGTPENPDMKIRYYTWIDRNGEIKQIDDKKLYNQVCKGDSVQIIERFWPKHRFIYKKVYDR